MEAKGFFNETFCSAIGKDLRIGEIYETNQTLNKKTILKTGRCYAEGGLSLKSNVGFVLYTTSIGGRIQNLNEDTVTKAEYHCCRDKRPIMI